MPKSSNIWNVYVIAIGALFFSFIVGCAIRFVMAERVNCESTN